MTLTELGKLYNEKYSLYNQLTSLEATSNDVQKYLDLQNEIGKLDSIMKQMTTDIAMSVVEWKPDRISKGKKDIFTEGMFSILRSKRTMRTIIPKEFVKRYPLEANVMIEDGKIKIPIGVVEAELGKNALNDICEAYVTYSYELMSRMPPQTQTEETPNVDETKDKRKTKKGTAKTKTSKSDKQKCVQ